MGCAAMRAQRPLSANACRGRGPGAHHPLLPGMATLSGERILEVVAAVS